MKRPPLSQAMIAILRNAEAGRELTYGLQGMSAHGASNSLVALTRRCMIFEGKITETGRKALRESDVRAGVPKSSKDELTPRMLEALTAMYTDSPSENPMWNILPATRAALEKRGMLTPGLWLMTPAAFKIAAGIEAAKIPQPVVEVAIDAYREGTGPMLASTRSWLEPAMRRAIHAADRARMRL